MLNRLDHARSCTMRHFKMFLIFSERLSLLGHVPHSFYKKNMIDKNDKKTRKTRKTKRKERQERQERLDRQVRL